MSTSGGYRCAKCGGPVVEEPGADGEPEFVHDGSAWPDRDEVHDFRFCFGNDESEDSYLRVEVLEA